jgi:GNAT superfamily N-acetyltransferase
MTITLKDFEIRPATEGDAPLILSFIKKLAVYEKLAHKVTADEDILRETLFGERRHAEVVIGYHGGEPVGFALFFHNYSTFLAQPGIYLEDLFVLPEHRGGGTGRALLERLAQIAVERGCGRMEWAVLNWNKDAIRFYERLGARPNSEWTVYRLAGDPLRALAGQ